MLLLNAVFLSSSPNNFSHVSVYLGVSVVIDKQ